MNRTVLLGLLLVVLLSCKTKQQIVQQEPIPMFEIDQTTLIPFYKNAELSLILEMADEQDKLTFVEVYTEWCLPCQIMDETVFLNKVLSEYYKDHFLSYKLNAEEGEGPDLSFIFQVQEYPTFLILDKNGRVIAKDKGGKSVSQMMLFAEEAVKAFGMRSEEDSGE